MGKYESQLKSEKPKPIGFSIGKAQQDDYVPRLDLNTFATGNIPQESVSLFSPQKDDTYESKISPYPKKEKIIVLEPDELEDAQPASSDALVLTRQSEISFPDKVRASMNTTKDFFSSLNPFSKKETETAIVPAYTSPTVTKDQAYREKLDKEIQDRTQRRREELEQQARLRGEDDDNFETQVAIPPPLLPPAQLPPAPLPATRKKPLVWGKPKPEPTEPHMWGKPKSVWDARMKKKQDQEKEILASQEGTAQTPSFETQLGFQLEDAEPQSVEEFDFLPPSPIAHPVGKQPKIQYNRSTTKKTLMKKITEAGLLDKLVYSPNGNSSASRKGKPIQWDDSGLGAPTIRLALDYYYTYVYPTEN